MNLKESNELIADFNKAVKVVQSCDNASQLKSAINYMALFDKKHPDKAGTYALGFITGVAHCKQRQLVVAQKLDIIKAMNK